MVANVTTFVREILENGFQLEPGAFKLIERLGKENSDIRRVIEEIIKNKIEACSERTITEHDLIDLLSTQSKVETTAQIEIKARIEIGENVGERVQLLEGKGGFESLFKSRYQELMQIVSTRPDYFRIEKISLLRRDKKEGRRKVAGLVMRKRMRRNNIVLTIDDDTGILEALAIEKSIMDEVKQVLFDSLVILDIEFSERNSALVKSVNLPDIPEHTPNCADQKVYAIFTSDLHVGSSNFLSESFKEFTAWLKQSNDEVVSKVKYLVIAGDAVDGIGVYPGQESDLEIQNPKDQYVYLSDLLKQIPRSIEIFVIPGNHDPVRQALPQPSLPKKYAEDLYNLDNVTVIGNPAWLSLHGVNILVYHGRSLDDVMATTPGFTFNRPAIAMKSLLRARHLAPVYGERTLIVPEVEDHLVVKQVPDIFHAGHVHTLDSEKYRGTLILNSGSWQAQTPFQAKMGIVPMPGIVPVVDLSTFEVFTKDFRQRR